jgi:hypothetical protein
MTTIFEKKYVYIVTVTEVIDDLSIDAVLRVFNDAHDAYDFSDAEREINDPAEYKYRVDRHEVL